MTVDIPQPDPTAQGREPSDILLSLSSRLQMLRARLEIALARAQVPEAERETWTPSNGQPSHPSKRRDRRSPGGPAS